MINNLTAWIYSIFNPCSKYESLIATYAYEELSQEDKKILNSHIAVCDKCRKDYEEIIGFVGKINRVKDIVLSNELNEGEIDLLPALTLKISARKEVPNDNSYVRRRIPVAVGLSIASIVLVFWGYVEYGSVNKNETLTFNMATLQSSDNTKGEVLDVPLQRQKEKLRKIIENNRGKDFAGEALLMLADIEFSTEERYEEAHRLYRELRVNYPHIFSSSSQAVYRYNLLEEVSGDGYKPLYIINSSLNSVKDPIQQLEGIIRRHPGTLVAQLAVQKMLECYGDGKSLTPDKQIALLENIRHSISDPTVVAQVDYILGNLYWKQKVDLRRAEKLFESVYYSGPPSLKPMAHDALVQLVSHSQ